MMDNFTLIQAHSVKQAVAVTVEPSQIRYNEPKLNLENFLHTIGFILCGLPLFVINIPIFGIIITKQSLRMNYIVLAFVILHNGLTGLNNTILGITRLVDLYRFTEGELIDNDRCLLHSSDFLVLLILLNGLGLLANSVDRLLVVTLPIQYFRHTQLITSALLATVYIFAFIFMGTVVVIEIALPPRYISPLCLEQLVYAEDTYSVIICVRTIAAAASIPVMFAVIVIMHRRQKTMIARNRSTSFANIDTFIERQKRFTQTALLSCSITFFLYVVPSVNQLIHDRLDAETEDQMALFAVFLTSINSYNIVLVFVWRQKDARTAVRQLLTCSYPRKKSVVAISLSEPPPDRKQSLPKRTSIRFLSQSYLPAISIRPLFGAPPSTSNKIFSRRMTVVD